MVILLPYVTRDWTLQGGLHKIGYLALLTLLHILEQGTHHMHRYS